MPIINQIVKGTTTNITVESGYVVAIKGNVSSSDVWYFRMSDKSNNIAMWVDEDNEDTRYTKGRNPKPYDELYSNLAWGNNGDGRVIDCYYGGIIVNHILYYRSSHDSGNNYTVWTNSLNSANQIYTFGLNDPVIGDTAYQNETPSSSLGTISNVYSSNGDLPIYIEDSNNNKYIFDSFGSNYIKWYSFDGLRYVYSGGNTIPCLNDCG